MRALVSAVTNWDVYFFYKIFNLNGNQKSDRFFLTISRSADGYYYAIAIIVMYFLDKAATLKFIPIFLAALAIEQLLYHTIKRGVKRKRPFDFLEGVSFLIAPPDKFSFPSGHTAAAIIFAVLVSIFFPLIDLFVISWAILVGLSRIYIGVHYPTDVLAGTFLGFFCTLLALVIF